jgi:prepilin-type N-terminal cleavage/methylation domain-containing protein
MRTADRGRRAGYTFMEIVVVMAIIVVLASLSVPVISTMLADTRQTAAADMVQARLADTRARAMEEGRPWKLGYLASSGIYQLAPEDSDEWNNVQQEPIEQADCIRDQLPTDVIMAASAAEIRGGQGGGATGSMWETIGVYMPAGNARDDAKVYVGKAGFVPFCITLRALTGAVAVTIETEGGQP